MPLVTSHHDLTAILSRHGGTDLSYLQHHYSRFRTTLEEFDSTWDRSRGTRVLDIGAHWLHQAVLWQRAGYQVTALDLPATFDLQSVCDLAQAERIAMIKSDDLEKCEPLKALPANEFDVIIFCEIIEHITFNPVGLWKQVYRLLSPGGRIIVTTPNYYAWNGRCWNPGRFLKGNAGGITVDEILGTNTYGHHWREFSRHELIRYFCLLSPDFNTVKAKAIRNYYSAPPAFGKRLVQGVFETIPGLRPNLHLEVELTSKDRGIAIEPTW